MPKITDNDYFLPEIIALNGIGELSSVSKKTLHFSKNQSSELINF